MGFNEYIPPNVLDGTGGDLGPLVELNEYSTFLKRLLIVADDL